jgi:Arc/MetJ-type ribon-helix-helix transcriptional regulator
MKAYVEAQVLARQFSTPSEYIRSLIREDQLRRTHVESAIVNPANEAAATP